MILVVGGSAEKRRRLIEEVDFNYKSCNRDIPEVKCVRTTAEAEDVFAHTLWDSVQVYLYFKTLTLKTLMFIAHIFEEYGQEQISVTIEIT